jgi:hypothetical protein
MEVVRRDLPARDRPLRPRRNAETPPGAEAYDHPGAHEDGGQHPQGDQRVAAGGESRIGGREFNADDARLLGTFGGVIDGQWKVSVPTGNYLVLVSDFTHVVLRQASVTDDAVADLSMAAATVKPKMTAMADLSKLNPSLDVIGTDEAGYGGFDFGWSGIFPKVSPLTHVVAGQLHTEVANMWSTKGYQPFSFHGGHVKIHPIKRVVAATYQAASGAGAVAMDELIRETSATIAGEPFARQDRDCGFQEALPCALLRKAHRLRHRIVTPRALTGAPLTRPTRPATRRGAQPGRGP